MNNHLGLTVEDSAHKVSASPKRAKSGETVTLTVKPEEGYALDILTVIDSRGTSFV